MEERGEIVRCYHYESSNCRLPGKGWSGQGGEGRGGVRAGPLALYKYVTQGSLLKSKQSKAAIPNRGVRTDIPFSQIGDIYNIQSTLHSIDSIDYRLPVPIE